MTRLEDIKHGTMIEGILPNRRVRVFDVKWHGDSALEVTYKDEQGNLGGEIIYRFRENDLALASSAQTWSFDADGGLLRLVTEACRIRPRRMSVSSSLLPCRNATTLPVSSA